MNKKRLLSLVVSFTLVFTTIFAGAGSAFAGEKVADEPVKSTIRSKMLYPEYEEAGFSAKAILYSNYSAPQWNSYTLLAGGYVSIVPIKASVTGWMYLDVKGDEYNDSMVEVYLVDKYLCDAEGMISIPEDAKGDEGWVSAGKTGKNECQIPVSKGKTYYALLISQGYSKVNPVVSLRAKVYTTCGRTISGASTSKYAIASGINKDGKTGNATWFKIKAEKSGVMTVTLKEYGYSSSNGDVKLYNADKKVRSETVRYSSSGTKVNFGVKKGRTYYLKVTNSCGSSSEAYKFGVRYTISSATDRNIGSKSKAKRLYRKDDSTKSLFVAANENSSDYYKFTVKTARKTKITVKTNNITSGYVIMRLYNSKGKFMEKLELPAQREGCFFTDFNLSKGTYYVKITKSLKASGAYTIRWTY